MEGVCYAGLYKWERDTSGKQVLRVKMPIYTRIRYTESRVDGFNDVNAAWDEFLKASYDADAPETDGWNRSKSCADLSSPRRAGEQNWIRSQEQATYQRVFMPTYGIADTPEERALEAKATAEAEARLAARRAEEERQKQVARVKAAEEERQRAAAESARRAEVARVEAVRQQKVDAIADQIGAGKRAEAERLQRMNDELAALRPKPKPSPTPRQCTQRQGVQQVSSSASTREAAERSVAGSRATPGGSESIVSSSVSGSSCAQRNIPDLLPKPPVGTCLACISEAMAANLFGWVKGKGYPPPQTEWVCSAQVTFTAERCGNGTAKVTAQ